MGEYVLKSVGKLKGVNISKAILNIGIHNKLCKSENFTTQVEGIPKSRLFAFFGSQCSANTINIKKLSQIEKPTLRASSSYCSRGEGNSDSIGYVRYSNMTQSIFHANLTVD